MTSVDETTDKSGQARGRATFEEARRAMREAMRRLHALPVTKKHRQWEAVVADAILLVGSYTRTTDAVAPAELARYSGVSEKTVHRAMEWAHENGVLIWWRRRGLRHVTLPLDTFSGNLSEGTDTLSGNLSASECTDSRGRSGAPLVALLVAEAKTVSPDQWVWIAQDPKVADAADACADAGRSWADLRKALDEKKSDRIDHGPRWAITILGRVKEGRPLKGSRKSRRKTSCAARPSEDFGDTSSQRLGGW